ncbi:TetR/AcrR family transcriptional regulator [Prauserella muralis]|uniref:TetR family transcriptional regulator n=1 Tax=Prauserella muralis TaxID=588067 RepID=A0A2V4ALN7_9PSEU|nr:TetR/AcrR family transcriptional regulator [Prauserella muralis]PXY21211.1 TetR family transcriptional regulator [Prauserella muralis]TWE30318.1 TetR family transcriptional regulator [Prauserella muralis]
MTSVYGGSGDPARSIELLWGLREPPRRGPKPKLTVDGIAAAAIGIADAEGLAALSMRRVAAELGVTAMSLYSYVPGKAELIDVMVDRVVGENGVPDHEPGGWRSRLERVARQAWDRYLRHPWLLQVATSRPVLGPNIIARYDYELRAVAGIGLSNIEMDLVVSMIADYVHGAVRTAVELAQAEQQTGKTDIAWWEERAPLLAKVFDAERYPVAAEVGAAAGEEYQAAVDPARSFEFGLARLLDGVAVLVERAARGETA